MFALIFGSVAKIPTDGIPPLLFYMTGVINWSYFSDCLTKTSDTFIENAATFGKVYFPRLTVPVSIVIFNIIKYIVQYSIFIVIYFVFIYRGYNPEYNWIVLLTPVILLYMSLMSLGFGIWISSITTKYKDIRFALPFFIQLWMYATPVIYPLSIIPEKYRIFILLNPMAPVIEIFRMGYLGAGTVSVNHILISVCITFFVLLSGIVIFNRIERTFMDTV
jgi:lipopolysaccharide transport system permease protein